MSSKIFVTVFSNLGEDLITRKEDLDLLEIFTFRIYVFNFVGKDRNTVSERIINSKFDVSF